MRKLLLAAAVAVMPIAANANMLYTFGTSNLGAPAGPGPYGGVVVQLNSATSATFTFLGFSVAGFDYGFTDMGLNLNLTSAQLASITSSPVAVTLDPLYGQAPANFTIDTSASNMDGFGNFDFIQNATPTGQPSEMSKAVFTLTLGSGSFVDEAHVLTPNSKGFSAADHLLVNGGAPVGLTGFATDTTHSICTDCVINRTIVDAPEPTALAMLATGLLGLGMVRYRKHRV
jgi:hypothetical protein